MASFADDVLAVDREQINLRAGLIGLVVLGTFGAAVAVWGPTFVAAAFGALVVLATDPPVSSRGWLVSVLPLTLAGTATTFLAVWIGARPVPAAVLVGAVGAAMAMSAGDSRKAGIRALIATTWVVLALTLGDSGTAPLSYAIAFALGAVSGGAVAWLRVRKAAPEAAHESAGEAFSPRTASESGDGSAWPFAILRGLGLGAAVFIGFTLFPAHPAWVAISSLIVMRPPTRQALIVGLQRSLGTGVGVLVTVVIAGFVGENTPALIILFLASAFFAMAYREANYALFAMFVTALVVYSQRLLGADAGESGQSRFVETVVGVAIAFIVLAIAQALARKEH